MDYQEVKNFGPSGLAEVRVLANKVKIIFQEDGDLYELPLEGWPEGLDGGNYFVLLNKDRTEAVSVKPPKGQYIAKFTKFKRPQGSEIPEPFIQRGGPRRRKDGGSWWADDEMRYAAYFVIVDGPYAGLQVSFQVPYIFSQKPGTTEAFMVGKQRQFTINEKFLRALGVDMLAFKLNYSPNVLPQLESMLLEKEAFVLLEVSDKGFVDNYSGLPAGFVPSAKTTARTRKAK